MKVICFGDSNTYGYDPRSYFGDRYEQPWPEYLESISGWQVINQGHNGLQIPKHETAFPEDTDLLMIMLGTNDLLQGNESATVCGRMEKFLKKLTLEGKKILLIAPPVLKPGTWVQDQKLIAESQILAQEYESLSRRLDIDFADSGRWNIPLVFDGVHFDQEGHRIFARKVLEHKCK